MKLVELYQNLTSPTGFNSGEDIPHGLYEAKNVMLKILNDGLKDTGWEAYTVDEVSKDSNRTKYRVCFRPEGGNWIESRKVRIDPMEILAAAEKDWKINTIVSISRRV